MKIVFLIIALYLPSLVKAQYKTEVITNPSNNVYVFLGSLGPVNEGNLFKLKIDILGGAWEGTSVGETTYYIANRSSLTIHQTLLGGGNDNRFSLHAYTNSNGGIDFYLLTSSYTAIGVKSCMVGGNATQLINNTTSPSPPAGLAEITPLNIVYDLVTDASGNVGIGTNAPKAKLQASGTMLINGTNANIDPNDANNGNISFLAGSAQMLIGWNRSAGDGEADFISSQLSGLNGGYSFYNYDNSNNVTQLMRIKGTGQVLIGPDNHPLSKLGSNKLAVSGGILAEQVTVKLQGSWPDAVFMSGYRLRPLSEVKAYVDTYHHLPEVPSEAAVAASGQDLGEMNKLLLKKVEELTLYIIELKKEVDELKAKQN